MLDMERFAKVLALAGSDADGEALAALRKARKMLQAANMSFTDIAQSAGGGGRDGSSSAELTRLRLRLTDAEILIEVYQQEIAQLRARKSTPHHGPTLKRTRVDIEATIRAALKAEPHSSDREIARRVGLSPQTVGNWRRRLEAERASRKRTVHNGRKRAA